VPPSLALRVAARPLGRRSRAAERNETLDLTNTVPQIGVPALQKTFPQMARELIAPPIRFQKALRIS
jgi:hypothetical protein